MKTQAPPEKQWSAFQGLSSLVVVLVLLGLFALFPSWGELLYRQMMYPLLRIVWDHTLGLLPFPVLYLALLFLPIRIFVYFRQHALRTPAPMATALLNGTAWIVAGFFWMWGFHYSCKDFRADHSEATISTSDLFACGKDVAVRAAGYRNALHSIPDEVDADAITMRVRDYLAAEGWNVHGSPRIRQLPDRGFLRRIAVAGIYFPYTLEGYVSDTYDPLVRTFTIAHESAHAFGVTHEGEADYIAYRALSADSSFWYRYAAELELLRSIRSLLYVSNDSLRQELIAATDPAVNADIDRIVADARNYPEYFPGAGAAINDRYLRTMGVQEGTAAYDLFVAWVIQESAP